MNFDDILKDAWQSEHGPTVPRQLASRVHRHQWRLRLQRGVEIVLTLIFILMFGSLLVTGSIKPVQWLLLPFFVLYLPTAWAFILRAPQQHHTDAVENTRLYAQLRMSQIRNSLRELWLVRTAGWALLAYAIAVNAAVWLLGDAKWRAEGLSLFCFVLIWTIGAFWFVRRRRSSFLNEYRSMKRLADP